MFEVEFVQLSKDAPKFFGFAEYLAGLALIVLAWTTADYRYKFRIETARFPMLKIAYYTIGIIGVLTILTDLWRASEWSVIKGHILTPELWQSILAFGFLLVFLLWAAIAFVMPPHYNSATAEKFMGALYRAILKGDAIELGLAADELRRSAEKIVSFHQKNSVQEGEADPKRQAETSNDLFEVMTDQRFAQALVSSAPVTLYVFLDSMQEGHITRRMTNFLHAIFMAAIRDKKSFLHLESSNHGAGFQARQRPLTRAMFGNIDMLDRSLFLFSFIDTHDWNHHEWTAFLRASSQAINSYVLRQKVRPSETLGGIFSTLEMANLKAHEINGHIGSTYQHNIDLEFRAFLKFLHDGSRAFAAYGRDLKEWNSLDATANPLQMMAEVAYRLILATSQVNSPTTLAWTIRYNTVWSAVFSHYSGGEKVEEVMKEIKARLIRMIWSQIARLDEMPDYVGGALLGVCLDLNIAFGDRRSVQGRDKQQVALMRLINWWTIKRFSWLYEMAPHIATHAFCDGMSYDATTRIISRSLPFKAIDGTTYKTELLVQPPPAGAANDNLIKRPRTGYLPGRRRILDRYW